MPHDLHAHGSDLEIGRAEEGDGVAGSAARESAVFRALGLDFRRNAIARLEFGAGRAVAEAQEKGDGGQPCAWSPEQRHLAESHWVALVDRRRACLSPGCGSRHARSASRTGAKHLLAGDLGGARRAGQGTNAAVYRAAAFVMRHCHSPSTLKIARAIQMRP